MIRPYLTFDGDCEEAIELYKKAFKVEVLELLRFSDIPELAALVSDEMKSKIVQARLQFGETFIRMSDCGPGHKLNTAESERISLVIETSVEDTKLAFEVLAEEGRIGMALEATFYSPCAGVVFDKFGVMWNLAVTK